MKRIWILVLAVTQLLTLGICPTIASAGGGFETGACAEIGERADPWAFAIDSTIVHSGQFSCRFQPLYGEGMLVLRPFVASPGQTYRVSLWINITHGYVAINNDAYLGVDWRDSNDDFAGTTALHQWIDATSGWEEFTAVITAPARATSGRLVFDCDRGLVVTTADVITGYLDDVLVENLLPMAVYLPLINR